jgi:hypothetical protein
MSCNATFAADMIECPHCQVGLSLVRKCPKCERIQSAQHISCIYCADSFLAQDGEGVLARGPIARRREAASRRATILGFGALAVVVAAGVGLYFLRRPPDPSKVTAGQSYTLRPTSLRARPAPDAPPIKDLEPSEVVNITGAAVDAVGHRWFRVKGQDVSGFVSVQDVSPPKATDPERGFELFRHYLLGLEDPDVLGDAKAAVDYYRSVFPGNPHTDEMRFLLAEKTRELAQYSRQRRALLARAREQYEEISKGEGEYAERARQALAQLPRQAPLRGPEPPASASGTLGFTLEGETSGSGYSIRELGHHVTLSSGTPVIVRLAGPVRVSPGEIFQGEVDPEIRINKEVAVPRGSVARMSIGGPAGITSGMLSPLAIRFNALVIGNQIYSLSASAVRVRPPRSAGLIEGSDAASPRLPAGTEIEFRLSAPLVVAKN